MVQGEEKTIQKSCKGVQGTDRKEVAGGGVVGGASACGFSEILKRQQLKKRTSSSCSKK